MRALRVVGITEDGSVVLEDSARRERFTVPADEQLRAAARGDLTRLGQIAIELESQLRPREIQARIRAGASVEQVASAAGVPVHKIERFAYPVLLERTRTAELAQAAHPVRDDGPDVRTLAETVAHTFGLRGQEPGADWDSWKGEDGKWVVALGWRSGRSDIRAHWVFQPGAHGGTVTALDDHARDLVEGRPQQPLRPVGPVIDMARPDDTAAEVAAEVVPAAVNGDARRIAPEQRRGSLPGRREPVRGATRAEVRSELAGPPTHPAARSTDTLTTDTRASDVGRSGIDSSAGRDGAERVGGREVVGREAAVSDPASVSAASVSASADGGSEPVENVPDEAPAVVGIAAPEVEKAERTEAPVDRPATVVAGAAPQKDVPAKIAEPEDAEPEDAGSEAAAEDAGSKRDESTGAAEAPGKNAGGKEAGGKNAGGKDAGMPARAEQTRNTAAGKATPAKPAAAPADASDAAADKAAADEAPTSAESAAAPAGDARPAGRAEGDQPAPAKRTKKGKPVMPSWDEVLLGVRGR